METKNIYESRGKFSLLISCIPHGLVGMSWYLKLYRLVSLGISSDITWKFSGISSGIMCYHLEI